MSAWGKWVNVNRGLPDEQVEVYACNAAGWAGLVTIFNGHWYDSDGRTCDGAGITHWCHTPSLPRRRAPKGAKP